MEEKISYYAIIPADVRYDDRLKSLTKLLYGELTALCNKYGFCWANNSYFANLYKASQKTISRCISELKECGYINLELQYKKDSKEVEKRIIKLKNTPMDKNVHTYGQNCPDPMDKNVQDNNTSINNTINISNKFIPPTVEQVKEYCEERNNCIDPEAFVDFYQSKGWVVGKNKMKDWKAAVRTWERNRTSNLPSKPQESHYSFRSVEQAEQEQREYWEHLKEIGAIPEGWEYNP